LVGVHGNPMMGEYVEKRYKPINSNYCPYFATKEMHNLFGGNVNFWRIELTHLNLKEPVFVYGGGCARFQYVFENNFWYPTSKQLSNNFGLNYTGQ